MYTSKTIYLSLGSNQGGRLFYLQQSCDAIARVVGVIQNISPIYKSESWGFNGNEFYNICISLNTGFNANEVLNKLQIIESELGREKQNSNDYQNRIIDIDILYYSSEVINTKHLTTPHPHIQNRKFVLQPLADIAPKFTDPISGKSISELLVATSDNTNVSKIDDKINLPISIANKYNFVAIEGNIGAGKTSLTTLMSENFNAKMVLERFADNPFLPKFYKDQDRFAFPLEMSFLADRYQQLSDDLAQFDIFKSFIVSDYYIFKSLIFSQVTLAEDEYRLYRKIFDVMYKDITKPNLYIYLYQNTERLLKNIKKRGRDYEADIKASYLSKIHKGYENFIRSEKNLNTLIIDVSELDFVNNYEDFLNVINQIAESK